jgi:hypothetical protein
MKTRMHVRRREIDEIDGGKTEKWHRRKRLVLTAPYNIGKTYQNIGRREAARRLKQRAKRWTASSLPSS